MNMAHAGKGGIQQHSLGDDYPFTVVGTIRDGVTRYYIQNLVTGELYSKCNPFRTSEAAHEHCRFIKGFIDIKENSNEQ
jgi:hypothetical protein